MSRWWSSMGGCRKRSAAHSSTERDAPWKRWTGRVLSCPICTKARSAPTRARSAPRACRSRAVSTSPGRALEETAALDRDLPDVEAPGWAPPAPREEMTRPATAAEPHGRRVMTVSARVAERRVERHAAVDEEGRADHVIREVRGEPDRRPGNVVNLSDAAVGDLPEQFARALLVLPRLLVYGRLDRTGGNGVDADLLGGHLLRDRLHQELHPALGGRVVRPPRPRDRLMHGTHEDNLAQRARAIRVEALLPEATDSSLGAEKLSREVDVDDLPPLVQRHLGEARVPLDARVRHEDVDAPECLDGRVVERSASRRVRDVRLNRHDLAAVPACAFGDALGVLPARQVVEDDVRARGGECLHDTGPDAGASSGHDRTLSCETVSHRRHGSLLSRSRATTRTPPASSGVSGPPPAAATGQIGVRQASA